MPRLGGADHGAQAGQPGLAHQALRAIGNQRREALEQGHVRRWDVQEVGSARVGRAHEHEDAGAGPHGAGNEGLEGVPARQRVRRRGIRSEAAHLAPRRGRRAEQRLRVGGGADRHVASLAVGDHQQARLARCLGCALQRRPAGGAEPFEARQLQLGGDAGRARLLDQAAAAGGDRFRRALGDPALRPRRPGVERRRVRIESQAELALPLLDQRGETVGERRRVTLPLARGGAGQRPGWAAQPFTRT